MQGTAAAAAGAKCENEGIQHAQPGDGLESRLVLLLVSFLYIPVLCPLTGLLHLSLFDRSYCPFLIHSPDASIFMAEFAASIIGIVSAGTKVALVLSQLAADVGSAGHEAQGWLVVRFDHSAPYSKHWAKR